MSLRFPSAVVRVTAAPMYKVLAFSLAFLAVRNVSVTRNVVNLILQFTGKQFSRRWLDRTIRAVSLQLRDVEDIMQLPFIWQDELVGDFANGFLDLKGSDPTRQELRCSHLEFEIPGVQEDPLIWLEMNVSTMLISILLLPPNGKLVPMRCLCNATLHLLHKVRCARMARMRRNSDRQIRRSAIVLHERSFTVRLMVRVVDGKLCTIQLLIPIVLRRRDIMPEHVFQHSIDSLCLPICNKLLTLYVLTSLLWVVVVSGWLVAGLYALALVMSVHNSVQGYLVLTAPLECCVNPAA